MVDPQRIEDSKRLYRKLVDKRGLVARMPGFIRCAVDPDLEPTAVLARFEASHDARSRALDEALDLF